MPLAQQRVGNARTRFSFACCFAYQSCCFMYKKPRFCLLAWTHSPYASTDCSLFSTDHSPLFLSVVLIVTTLHTKDQQRMSKRKVFVSILAHRQRFVEHRDVNHSTTRCPCLNIRSRIFVTKTRFFVKHMARFDVWTGYTGVFHR